MMTTKKAPVWMYYLVAMWVGWVGATQHYHVTDTQAQSEWLRGRLTTYEHIAAARKPRQREGYLCRTNVNRVIVRGYDLWIYPIDGDGVSCNQIK